MGLFLLVLWTKGAAINKRENHLFRFAEGPFLRQSRVERVCKKKIRNLNWPTIVSHCPGGEMDKKQAARSIVSSCDMHNRVGRQEKNHPNCFISGRSVADSQNGTCWNNNFSSRYNIVMRILKKSSSWFPEPRYSIFCIFASSILVVRLKTTQK